MRKSRCSSLPCYLFLFAATSFAAGLDSQAIARKLAEVTKSHPALVTTSTIGSSAGGRPIVVARVAAKGRLDPDSRPAVFVGANMAGWHHLGTEAALDLLDRLTSGSGNASGLLDRTTFYIVPILNPDAHDRSLRNRWEANDEPLDDDRDGLIDEDGPDDMDGDGRITWLRIEDPAGSYMADPKDERMLIAADSTKGEKGRYLLETEGFDNDGDGKWNEDGPGGIVLDRSFAHAFPYGHPESGPWAGYSSEARAVMDFLLAHRNIALAVTFGPGNSLLEPPKGFGKTGDLGTLKFKVPEGIAGWIGVDPEEEYTGDQIWDIVKDLGFVKRNEFTKEQVLQFIGAGPATSPDKKDLDYLDALAKDYKKRMKDAKIPTDRPTENYRGGGFTPWLYYQYGVLPIELDLYRIPNPKKKADKKKGTGLTIEKLAAMSQEEFLALDDEAITAFLKEQGAPPGMTATRVKEGVRSGMATPAKMAEMAGKMKTGSGGEEEEAGKRERAVLDWLQKHRPEAFVPWKKVKLKDGRRAEVGGVDRLVEWEPPETEKKKVLDLHTDLILNLALKLARLKFASVKTERLAEGIYRVEADIKNGGFLPTHTRMARKARVHLPVRLEMKGALVSGKRFFTSELLDGGVGSLHGEWLVKGAAGSSVLLRATSDDAGILERKVVLGGKS